MKSRLRDIFFVSLVASLLIEGILLLFTGWWLPEAPILLRLMGAVWLIVCVSTYFIRATEPFNSRQRGYFS
jgi:CHASE2 domain-containing sensor protein